MSSQKYSSKQYDQYNYGQSMRFAPKKKLPPNPMSAQHIEETGYNKDVVNELVKLQYGTKDQCINASKSVIDYNDINQVSDKLQELAQNKPSHFELIYNPDTTKNNNKNHRKIVPKKKSPTKALPAQRKPYNATHHPLCIESHTGIVPNYLPSTQLDTNKSKEGYPDLIAPPNIPNGDELLNADYITELEASITTKNNRITELEIENKRLMQQNETLLTSKEEMYDNYTYQVQQIMNVISQSNSNNTVLIQKLNETIKNSTKSFEYDIQRNKREIRNLTKHHKELKMDMVVTKEIYSKSITAIHTRINNMEQLNLERYDIQNKINNKFENLLSTSSATLKLQQQIHEICKNEYIELFYKTIAKRVTMMFFDAKVVISDFVDHAIATKNKAMQGIKAGAWVLEKLANDIPFVSTVIGLVKTAANKAYDTFVLKVLARYGLEFEICLAEDAPKFPALFALNITKKSLDKIEEIKNNHCDIKDREKRRKKIMKNIESKAEKYSDNLIKIICTGYGENIYRICKIENTYLDVLAHLTIRHPIRSIKKKKSDFQAVIDKEELLQFLTNIESEEAKKLITSYFDQFRTKSATAQFINGVIDVAKQELNHM